jgi:hypothetical protein
MSNEIRFINGARPMTRNEMIAEYSLFSWQDEGIQVNGVPG